MSWGTLKQDGTIAAPGRRSTIDTHQDLPRSCHDVLEVLVPTWYRGFSIRSPLISSVKCRKMSTDVKLRY